VKKLAGIRLPARLPAQFLERERLQQRFEPLALPVQRRQVDSEQGARQSRVRHVKLRRLHEPAWMNG
jgi:hypothetical protein